jgi:hypothetical protein
MGRMAQLFVLVHAPVLGPAAWRPVAERLCAAGHHVVVPSLTGFAAGGPPYARRFAELAAAQVPGGPQEEVVLVTHSGAGVFAGQLSARLGAGRCTAIFADAGLPDRAGGGPVVDAGFLPYLRRIAAGGQVPPWHRWWPGADLAPLFPDDAARDAVTREARPLPLAFFEETLPPVPGGWPPNRGGYLLFSAGYRDQARAAGQSGWPVTELPGEHLHMLVDPAAVAAAICQIVADGQGLCRTIRHDD